MSELFHIAVVEDDDLLRSAITNLYSKKGYKVSGFSSAEGVFEYITTSDVDVLVCDIMLPTTSGYDLFERLDSHPNLGKIFISSKIELEHRIKGLSLGADDYICKPLDSIELLLRTEALIKRLERKEKVESNSAEIEFNNFTINAETRVLSGKIDKIELGLIEHQVLILLIAYQGKVCSREKIYETLGNDDTYEKGRALDNIINRIRKKMIIAGGNEKNIVTFRGSGFMLSDSQNLL